MAISQDVVEQWVTSLRASEPGAVAILLKGSVARGTPHRFSDLDLDVLTSNPDEERYLSRLEHLPDGLRHTSIAVWSIDDWLRDATEPVEWAYGLAARESCRVLWADSDATRSRLPEGDVSHPAATGELEDTCDALAKLRAAMDSGHRLAVRQAAQWIGTYAPALVAPVNAYDPPHSASEALGTALSLRVVPLHWHHDVLTCLGLQPANDEDVIEAAFRLVSGIARLIVDQPEAYRDSLTADELHHATSGDLAGWIRYLAT